MDSKEAAIGDNQSTDGTKFERRAHLDAIRSQDSAEDATQVTDPHGEDVALKETPRRFEPSIEVNMDATTNADDLVRAGGFGARDDISSFLPVASDSTDFEASLLNARNYEDPQVEQRRPGLGWSENKVSE